MARSGWQRGTLRCRNGLWSVRIRQRSADGKRWLERTLRVGATAKFRTRGAARLEADRVLEREQLVAPIKGKAIAFDAFAALYLADYAARMQPTTRAGYRSIIRRHLVPALGKIALHAVSGPTPGRVVTRMVQAGLSRATVRAAMAVLGRMLETAAELGYAAPALNKRAYRLPPAAARREPRCFTPAESAAIIEAAPYPWKACFALMAYAGLRVSEALAIEWRHIDLANHQLHIRQAAAMGRIKAVKSSNSAADLPIAPPLFDILRGLRIWRNFASGLLFPAPNGQPYWSATIQRRHLTPLLKRLGIPHGGLHAFRHGLATNMFASGAAAPVVRSMLRHGDIKTTLRYTHVTGNDLRDAAAAAASRITPKEAAP